MNQYERWQVTRFLRGLAKLIIFPFFLVTWLPTLLNRLCQLVCRKLDDWWL